MDINTREHYYTQDWGPSLIVYGDMGRTGGEPSLPALIQEVASGGYDAILHVGDFAYDLDSDGGVVSLMIECCMPANVWHVLWMDWLWGVLHVCLLG